MLTLSYGPEGQPYTQLNVRILMKVEVIRNGWMDEVSGEFPSGMNGWGSGLKGRGCRESLLETEGQPLGRTGQFEGWRE